MITLRLLSVFFFFGLQWLLACKQVEYSACGSVVFVLVFPSKRCTACTCMPHNYTCIGSIVDIEKIISLY